MASNKELAAEAVELAEELGIEVTTDGLNNKALSALVSDLKAKKKDAELQTQADEADGDQPDADEADGEELEQGYYVAKGKAVTSKIGIMSDGAAVKAKHFVGGQETLDHLVERGHCVKVG